MQSNFNINGNGEIRRFDGAKFVFTSTFSNNREIFYGMGIDLTNNKNVMMSYDYTDPSSRAKVYDFEAHGTNLHSHSVILSEWTDTFVSNFPVTGFYAGATTGVSSLTLCE